MARGWRRCGWSARAGSTCARWPTTSAGGWAAARISNRCAARAPVTSGRDRRCRSTVIQDEGVGGAGAAAAAVERLLSQLPHVVVNERGAKRAAHGNALADRGPLEDATWRRLPATAGARAGPGARRRRRAAGDRRAGRRRRFCNRSLSWCKILSPLELDVRRRGRSPPCGGPKGGSPFSGKGDGPQ